MSKASDWARLNASAMNTRPQLKFREYPNDPVEICVDDDGWLSITSGEDKVRLEPHYARRLGAWLTENFEEPRFPSSDVPGEEE